MRNVNFTSIADLNARKLRLVINDMGEISAKNYLNACIGRAFN